MLTGASDPAVVVDQCISELKAAGLDTVIAEAQKQVDEFFAEEFMRAKAHPLSGILTDEELRPSELWFGRLFE